MRAEGRLDLKLLFNGHISQLLSLRLYLCCCSKRALQSTRLVLDVLQLPLEPIIFRLALAWHGSQ